jgi:thiamine biosynthesis lipoprotein
VDQAIQALRTQGVAGGWVNAGGDLRVFGVASLPVQQRMFDGQLRALGALRDAAVASSRTVRSQQAWAADQATFPGLVMAPEQQEVPDGVWTVLASTCWRADALTKVAALAPPAQREALVRRLGGMLLPQT